MKKLILGLMIGSTMAFGGMVVASELNKVECSQCGETFMYDNTADEIGVCDGCYGFYEGMSKATNTVVTIELGDGSQYNIDLTTK